MRVFLFIVGILLVFLFAGTIKSKSNPMIDACEGGKIGGPQEALGKGLRPIIVTTPRYDDAVPKVTVSKQWYSLPSKTQTGIALVYWCQSWRKGQASLIIRDHKSRRKLLIVVDGHVSR